MAQKSGSVFGSQLRRPKWPQSQNTGTIAIRSATRVEWYTFCLVPIVTTYRTYRWPQMTSE